MSAPPSAAVGARGARRGWPVGVAGAVDAPPRRRWVGVVLAAPIVALAAAGWAHRWMSDDAFINLRVVDNLLAGHGPVFNVGERVEVATSPAWLGVLVAGRLALPFVPSEWLAVIAGLVATLLGLAAGTAGAVVFRRAVGRVGSLLPAGSLVVAALPPFWEFATSGLETGLTFLWLGGSFWLLARRYRRYLPYRGRCECWRPPPPAARPMWPALVVGLGPLVRPDLTLIAAPLGVALLLLSRRGWRSWLGGAATMLALPVGCQVLRMGSYAALVPNTAIAKSAGASLWQRGATYLGDYA